MALKRFFFICLSCLICSTGYLWINPYLYSFYPEKTIKEIPVIAVKEKNIDAYNIALEGFLETLRKQNISILPKVYDQSDKYLVNKINDIKPALILTLGSGATKKVHRVVKDIPIIFSMVLDPEGSNIHSSGLVGAALDIPPRLQLKTLKRILPQIKKIGVIYSLQENESFIRKAKNAANELGINLKTYSIKSEIDIPRLTQLSIELLWIIPDSMVCKPAIVTRFIRSGLKNGIAVMGFTRSYSKAGALLSLTCDYKDNGRQAAEIALKFLRNRNTRNLKTSTARRVKLYLNLTAANILGLTISQNTIEKASEVF